MIKLFSKLSAFLKYYFHLKKKFNYLNKKKFNNIFLVEFFPYYPSLIAFSHYAEIISKNFNAQPVLYDPRLPTKKLKDFVYKIKRIMNPILYLYKMFGFKDFYFMKSNSITKKKST